MPILNLMRIFYIFCKYRLDELFDSLINKNLGLIIFFIPRIIFKKKGALELRVADALEEMGPLFIKFGQLLSTRPDLVGIKQADSLKKFLNKLDPFPTKEAIKIVRIDIDKNPSLVATYNIREIPNLFLFKNGQKEFTKKKNLTKASITQWVIENI